MTRQTLDGVRQYRRLSLRDTLEREIRPDCCKFRLSHCLASRYALGVIFRHSMHCECLRRVCIPLSEKPFRQSAPWCALYPRCVYTCGRTETFLLARMTRRAAIELCRYSVGNNTEIINISRLRRLPGEANALDHQVTYALTFAWRCCLGFDVE